MGYPLVVITNRFYGQRLVPINGICDINKGCTKTKTDGVPAYITIMQSAMFWIPKKIHNTLMTQLYLLNRSLPAIDLVYESTNLYDPQTLFGPRENIRIYKFNYTLMEKLAANNTTW